MRTSLNPVLRLRFVVCLWGSPSESGMDSGPAASERRTPPESNPTTTSLKCETTASKKEFRLILHVSAWWQSLRKALHPATQFLSFVLRATGPLKVFIWDAFGEEHSMPAPKQAHDQCGRHLERATDRWPVFKTFP